MSKTVNPRKATVMTMRKVCAVDGILSVSSLPLGDPSSGLSGISFSCQELASILVAMHFIEIVFIIVSRKTSVIPESPSGQSVFLLSSDFHGGTF